MCVCVYIYIYDSSFFCKVKANHRCYRDKQIKKERCQYYCKIQRKSLIQNQYVEVQGNNITKPFVSKSRVEIQSFFFVDSTEKCNVIITCTGRKFEIVHEVSIKP